MRLTDRRPRVRKKWLVRLAAIMFGAVVVGMVVILGIFIYFAKDLPSPDKVVRREGYSTKIFDRNGKLLYDVFTGERMTPVTLDEVPKMLQQATVAIEDKSFYTHAGVDPLTPFRIAYNLVVKRRIVGGSTLTQQLVKTVLLSNERTIKRKLKEFILTLQVESKYSKDQILQMYLNEVPYGGTARGIGEAAEIYFGKKVADLNLAEAVILAGLPQSPTKYSPYTGTAYIDRAKAVLRRMREDGYIDAEKEKETADLLAGVQISTQSGLLKAPHFVFYVKQELEERYGETVVEEGGLRVTTTLDLDLQEKAQQIVADKIAEVEYLKIGNGAAVVLNVKTGEILAMVGSKNWSDPDYDGKYNVVTAKRQPGSAIKPVVYLTALRKGYTASSLLMDTQTVFPGGDKPEYVPENYDGKFRGPMLVREALGNSINIPAVKMVSLVGIKEMLETAYDLGFTTLEPTTDLLKRVGLSIALGGGEVRLLDMAASYSVFANGGYRVEPVAILKVTDINGKVLEEYQETLKNAVASPGEAFIISSILSDNEARKITFGVGSQLVIPGKTVAVKTGTTNDKKDNWTVGWTPSYITGVWVGNNDNTPMKQVASGVTGASPIWRSIMQEILKDKPDEKFNQPEEIVEIDVDKVSGFRAHDGFESEKEYFIKGTEPWADDVVHKKIKVCKGEGKLATPADIASGNYEEKEALYFKEEDPFIDQDKTNKWQEGILNWLKDQAEPKYHPPTDYCSGQSGSMWVRLVEPNDRVRINSRDINVKVEVDGVGEVRKIEVFLDGQFKYRSESAPYEVTIPNVTDGYHRIDIRAEDDKGLVGTRYAGFTVNQDFFEPSPTPSP
jgi:1A family penicillin-binding protein